MPIPVPVDSHLLTVWSHLPSPVSDCLKDMQMRFLGTLVRASVRLMVGLSWVSLPVKIILWFYRSSFVLAAMFPMRHCPLVWYPASSACAVSPAARKSLQDSVANFQWAPLQLSFAFCGQSCEIHTTEQLSFITPFLLAIHGRWITSWTSGKELNQLVRTTETRKKGSLISSTPNCVLHFVPLFSCSWTWKTTSQAV